MTVQTTIAEIAEGIYRIHTPVPDAPGGFSFNQYLVVDDEPLLFHCGPRSLARPILEAIGRVTPASLLRWVGFAHAESDECGGMNALLAAAPRATPICSQVGAMVQGDLFDRAPRPLADGETLSLGARSVTWVDAPHVPHGWDNGFLVETTTRTLFCGDLFTQPGTGERPLVEEDVLGPSEAFRQQMDYWAHAPQTASVLSKLAATEPRTLACMHGSAFRGDGATLLRGLGDALSR